MDAKFLQEKTHLRFYFFYEWVVSFEPIQTHLAPQNAHVNLSFVKDENTVGENLARNGPKMAVYQLLFFRELAEVASGLSLHFRP